MNVSLPFLDRASIGLSALCMVHCLLTPIAIVMLPALSTSFLAGESFHRLMVVLVLPMSVLALGLGCRKHRGKSVLVLGGIGLGLLVVSAILGEEGLGEIGEKVATVFAASIVALAHVRNYMLCRQQQC